MEKGVGRTTGKSPRKGEVGTEDMRNDQDEAGYQLSSCGKGGHKHVLSMTECQALYYMLGIQP